MEKVVLITGAGNGIGRGCSDVLAKDYSIIANDIDAALLSNDWLSDSSTGRSINPLVADAFSEKGCEVIAREVVNRPLWGAVCNPYLSIQKDFLDFERDDFSNVLNAVFISHSFIAQAVARRMIEIGRGGRIIFIGSVYGALLNRTKSAPYDCGKAALEELTRVLALEWAEYGITVNCIAPGFTDTPGERRFATEEEIAFTASRMPLGRACTPADIGHAVAFLMSEEAAMVTGVILPVTAGMHLMNPA